MNRKRKLSINTNENVAKKTCIDWNTMISPSNIRNFLLDDPLLDWLKYYSIDTISSLPVVKNNHNYNDYNDNNQHNDYQTHTEFIMEQGIEFEKIVYNKLNEKFNIVMVTNTNESRSYQKYIDTVEYMKEGIDIIYQGVLHDYKNKLYGVPDLLVRSDKFKTIFNYNYNNNHNSPKLNQPFHYVVVDIKHSTLQLNCNKEYIKNINCVPAYKGQLLIYNRILGEIQGYKSSCGFILGKRSIHTKNGITIINENYMENIGVIDYNNTDSHYNEKVDKAIEWIRRMRTDGINWQLLPKPSVSELYPNMKNDKDNNYRYIKNELSNKINEITNIWWCGYNKRNIAHSKKIYSWKNKKLNASVMGFNDNKISKTIDNILNINRNNNIIIRTSDLAKASKEWKNFGNDTIEFYIDFETINGNIGQIEIDTITNDIIFMIGLGWIEKNIWCSKTFLIENNNDNDELLMMQNMWDFIKNKKKQLNKKNSIFIHWSHAEVTFYNKFLEKHKDIRFPIINFYDLYKLFLDNNIVVKGAFNFSLKSIAKALYSHNKISTSWDTKSSCSNGLQAMLLAYKIYKDNIPVKNNVIMDEIIKYNLIDCKVMWEILLYLRNNN
jgi:hypothetical protein